jgi:hypothetical protein
MLPFVSLNSVVERPDTTNMAPVFNFRCQLSLPAAAFSARASCTSAFAADTTGSTGTPALATPSSAATRTTSAALSSRTVR